MTKTQPITVLAIETSCDETGVAMVEYAGSTVTVLAAAVASQMDIHAATGGVIPEVAAREHVVALQPMIKEIMSNSKRSPQEVTAIAVTAGPGLQPALAVGVTAARTLAYGWGKPLIPVQHLEGHIYSALLRAEQFPIYNSQFFPSQRDPAKAVATEAPAGKQTRVPITYALPTATYFPALALIVSGGHTQLILVHDHVTYEVVGSTKDDAAGEAFDKVARLLGLSYPGGPAISALAPQGNAAAFPLTIPLAHTDQLDFSFSGLKTAVLYAWRDLDQQTQDKRRADMAASFEYTVVEALAIKTKLALERYQPKVLLLAGGVAANKKLQQRLKLLARELGVPLQIAPSSLTGDNAVMIGQAAVFAYERGRTIAWQDIDAQARLPITAFQAQ